MWSFIIPAHNEARLLADTLAALHYAAIRAGIAHEVIVVDDASTDTTAEIAAASGARVLRVEHRQIAATRNAGARLATGNVLVFVDADTRVDADLLRATDAALRRGVVGGGATVRFAEPQPLYVRVSTIISVWALKVARVIPGCYLFATRDAFIATGGFDETWFAAEDVVMSRALVRLGDVVILHQPVFTSARKLESHGVIIHLRLAWNFLRHGPRMLQTREHLGMWYDGRGRPSPHEVDQSTEK